MSTAQRKMSKTTKNNTNEKYKKRPKQKKKETNSTTGRQKQKSKVKKGQTREETKDVNTVSEAVPVWPPVRYISDTGQYRCTVSGLPLFYIYIYIYMYVCVSVYIYYNKYKSLQ